MKCTPDLRLVYFIEFIGCEIKLYRLNMSNGKIENVATPKRNENSPFAKMWNQLHSPISNILQEKMTNSSSSSLNKNKHHLSTSPTATTSPPNMILQVFF